MSANNNYYELAISCRQNEQSHGIWLFDNPTFLLLKGHSCNEQTRCHVIFIVVIHAFFFLQLKQFYILKNKINSLYIFPNTCIFKIIRQVCKFNKN